MPFQSEKTGTYRRLLDDVQDGDGELRVREGLLAVWSFLMGRRRAATKLTNTAVAAWPHEALPRDHQ